MKRQNNKRFMPLTMPANFQSSLKKALSGKAEVALMSNSLLTIDDSVTSVFNLTENKNSDETLDLLMKHKL